MKIFQPFVLVLLIGMVLFSGCVRYSLMRSEGKVEVGKAFLLDPQIDWNVSNDNGLTTWTVDGPLLQKLDFFPGVAPGDPLIEPKPGSDKEMPVFGNGMNSLEVMDLVEATLSRLGANRFKREKLTPVVFGKEDGFRFSFSFMSKAGLEYKGFAVGAIKREKLYLILYTGTKLHYYDRYGSEVEALVRSTEIL